MAIFLSAFLYDTRLSRRRQPRVIHRAACDDLLRLVRLHRCEDKTKHIQDQTEATRLISAGTLCLALTAQAQTAATLKVGVIKPFTGSAFDFTVQMLQGLQLAAEEINVVGGHMGRQLELILNGD